MVQRNGKTEVNDKSGKKETPSVMDYTDNRTADNLIRVLTGYTSVDI